MGKRGEIQKGSQTAMITGASSGIGLAITKRLADLGYNVVMVSNREENLLEAFEQVRTAYSVDVRYFAIDLAVQDSAYRLYEWCQQQGLEIAVLVNNAGAFSFLDIHETPTERIETILNLHTFTPTLTMRLFGARMAERGHGYILNMSSYSQWMPFPGLSLYGASKAYLKCFSRAYAKEVRERGVKVTATCPAGVATDLYGLTPKWQKIALNIKVLITADRCAELSLRALWRGRKTYIPVWWWRLFIPIMAALPRPITNFARRQTMRFQK